MPKFVLQLLMLVLLSACATSKKAKFDDYVFKTKSEKQSYIKSYNKSLKILNVPYIEEDIKTSYGIAYVIIAGPKNGKDLVLLHGMDASSTMWYPNIKALATNHRVFAIDNLMEPSKSTLTSKPLSVEEMVLLYNEIFNHYKLKKIDIIGASRGGWLATLLTIQKNSKIDKLVLLSPAQTFKNVDQKRKASAALLLKLFPNEKKLKKTLDAFAYYPDKISPVYKNQFYLANKYSKSNASLLQMLPFSDDELKSIKNPVLVLIGDHDVINSEDSLLRADEFLSNGKTETIKNAGHFLSMDQSKEVNEVILDFLK